MKKFICLLLCALMAVAFPITLVGCGTSRDEILKLYMPDDYIDKGIFKEFEKWYKNETGKTVSVELETFEAVEDIQRDVEDAKTDYDLLCPSDYMVEYLIKKNLIRQIDKSIIDVEEEGLFREEYLERAKEYDPQLKYSVPYMYGTLGIVYDKTKTGNEITSWDALFGNEFAGRRSIKKSMRDAYAAACIYSARNDADSVASLYGEAQKQKIQSIFEDTTETTIARAKSVLQNLRNDKGTVWDVDNIKFKMAANNSNVAVALMWSCDAGYVMNDYEDQDGVERSGNRNLWYVVPDEGGNVYIDNFVISKYAENVQAANYFLKFLCLTDIAVQNSVYAGCVSPVADAYADLYEGYMTDEEGMFDNTDAGWKEMFIETMFPSAETLNRCGIMKDFGDRKLMVGRMWNDLI